MEKLAREGAYRHGGRREERERGRVFFSTSTKDGSALRRRRHPLHCTQAHLVIKTAFSLIIHTRYLRDGTSNERSRIPLW